MYVFYFSREWDFHMFVSQTCRSAAPHSVALNTSLLDSSQDCLTTLRPFRVLISPFNVFFKLAEWDFHMFVSQTCHPALASACSDTNGPPDRLALSGSNPRIYLSGTLEKRATLLDGSLFYGGESGIRTHGP